MEFWVVKKYRIRSENFCFIQMKLQTVIAVFTLSDYVPLFVSPNIIHSASALTATPDNLLGIGIHSEWEFAAPGSDDITRGGHSGHILKSRETQPRSTGPGDLHESHYDSLSKETLPLLLQPHGAFNLPSQLPPFTLLCFIETLIKRKDRHDECEVATLTIEGNEWCVWASC